jgi:anaerobic selenocysteine-containing dehydrogenase
MPTVPTTCWECSTLCGALATVDEAGRVTTFAPNPAHPVSAGAFCVKGIRGLPELTYGPGRILRPLRRVGARGEGRWREVGWDEALDEMADRLAEVRERHGPLAIAGATSGAFFSRSAVFALLLRSIGSPNWMINQDLCGGCRGVSDMVTGLAITGGEDIARARTLLVVGANPTAANPIQWQRIKQAKAAQARMIVLDPLRTSAAEMADLWLRPRPGTDAAIALAMMHVLVRERRYDREFVTRWCHGFDALAARVEPWTPARAAGVCGVPAADIEAAARLYADGPSCFVSGHGIDAVSNGVQTFRAFHCLAAISGNVDRAGGNRRAKRPRGFRTPFDLLHDPAFRLPREVERQTIGAARFPLWAGPEGWQTACHNPSVIEAILTSDPYPVRALYVSGVNIAVTYPDTSRTLAALRSLDFLAVATHTMTPTAALADLVLPKTTALEEEEVSLHAGGPCIVYTAPASNRRGEARPDVEIAAGLLDRLRSRGAVAAGLMPWRTQRELNEFLLGESGIDRVALARDGFAAFEYACGDLEQQTFKTPSGKIELYSERLAALGLDPLPDWVPTGAVAQADPAYPFTLQTGLRERTYHHSRFRDHAWARKSSPDPLLRIHPDTARRLGIADGDWVQVETAGHPGRCRLRAKLTDATAPDTVATGMGWWRPDAAGPDYGALEVNINAAMTYAGPYDPASGSADTRGLRCKVMREPDR